MRTKSNLRILMAYNGFKSLKQLGEDSGVSWEILEKLDKNKKIESIRIGNLLKVCKSLKCKIEDLIVIPYESKDYSFLNLTENEKNNNLQILMAINNIDTLKDLMRYSGVSWKVVNKIEKSVDIDTLELSSVLKICSILVCGIDDLLNIRYDYKVSSYNF